MIYAKFYMRCLLSKAQQAVRRLAFIFMSILLENFLEDSGNRIQNDISERWKDVHVPGHVMK